jgi:hypothetical protein
MIESLEFIGLLILLYLTTVYYFKNERDILEENLVYELFDF